MEKSDGIYVAGHRGLVGSAFMRRLKAEGYANLITRTHSDLDLTCQQAVQEFFARGKPEYVFLAAAKVGGIHANNTYPAEFIYQNLLIQSNIIHAAYQTGVRRLLFLGSSCIYPKHAPQPLKEEYLLTGPLESTNAPYAVAKIAGIEMCEAYNRQYGTRFLAVMPTNLYGPNDNFDLETSHVLPALLRKFHEAKVKGDRQVVAWGTGNPRREFLHVDDMTDACLFLMNLSDEVFDALLGTHENANLQIPESKSLRHNGYARYPMVNIGCGEDITIRELVVLMAETVGFDGEVVWDKSKPDGTSRKLLDVSRLRNLGWEPEIDLARGLSNTYEWYRDADRS